MTQRKIKALIAWCRRRGAVRVKAGEVEVEFGAEKASSSTAPAAREELSPEAAEQERKREREALLYGSS